jgi:hypothetical protein
MDDQRSLPIRIAANHVYVAAHYDWRSGWFLRVSSQPVGPLQPPACDYEALSSLELVDVVLAELERRLNSPTEHH